MELYKLSVEKYGYASKYMKRQREVLNSEEEEKGGGREDDGRVAEGMVEVAVLGEVAGKKAWGEREGEAGVMR